MAFGCLLWDDQPQKKRYGFAIGRVEGNGKLRSQKHARHCVALGHSRVRNGDAMTQSGRAKPLAGHEAIQNLGVGQMQTSREKQRKPLEQSRLVRQVDVQLDIVNPQ